MPADPDINVQVALLGQQVNNSVKIFDKFDAAVDKLTGLTLAIQSTLQNHDAQIQRNAERTVELANTVFTSRKALDDKMHDLEKTLLDKIDSTAEGVADLKTDGQNQHNELVDKLGKHDKRLSNLERWMWILVGGGIVVAIIFRDFNLAHIFSQLGSL